MDKVKVNNQVVSMRKFVKKAKVHVISKLVKDITTLQKKKGTEQQLAKNKRKEERLVEEIKIIQKLSLDEVSRKSLLRLKDWKSLIPDKSVALNERSFARVASFEPLQKEVERFISENTKLVNVLPDLFEEWNTKKSSSLYHEAKKIKASERKFKKKQKPSRLKEKLESNLEFRQRFQTETGGHQNENKIKQRNDESETENLIQNDDEQNLTETKNCTEESTFETNEDSEDDSNNDVNFSKNSNEVKSEQKTEMAVFSLDDLQNEEIFKSNEDDSDEENDQTVEQGQHKALRNDDFFLGADESLDDEEPNEKAHISIDTKNFKSRFNNKDKQQHFTKKFSKFDHQSRTFKSSNNDKHFYHQRSYQPFDRNQQRRHSEKLGINFSQQNNRLRKSTDKNWSSKPSAFEKFSKNEKDSTVRYKPSQNSQDTDAKLHPSWAAKRKLKQQMSQLLPFQGKKITFNES